MKDIAIFGAGGFGKEVACLIDLINRSEAEPRWNRVGFFDDNKPVGTDISLYGKVLGGMAELNAWLTPLDLAVAIGNPHTVKKVVSMITNTNVDFPNVIHPNFGMADERGFSIGYGNIIEGGCFASCDVKIGNFNVLNGSDVLGHDVVIGDYNVIMPNIRISGEVVIGRYNMLGVGSIVLQRVSIGENVVLGAGSVLMTKPKNGLTYLGVPARRLFY